MLGELGVTDVRTPSWCTTGSGLFSAPRAWWNLRHMGARNVRVLDGGLPAWARGRAPAGLRAARGPRTRRLRRRAPARTCATWTRCAPTSPVPGLVVDVRPEGRFSGAEPEPRPGVRSGHMPGAVNLPFDRLIADGRLRPDAELRAAFEAVGASPDRALVTSCGSGVTAAIALLALEALGRTGHALYDGSWSEWGTRPDVDVVTGD